MPTDNWNPNLVPEFKHEGVTGVRLEDFPLSDLPSGGVTGRLSASEMYMVHTCVPTRQKWKAPDGRVLVDAQNVNYSFIGRFPWEIMRKGMYRCHIELKGKDKGFVEFEVV